MPIVIATIRPFGDWQTPELAGPHNDDIIQQTSLLQIADQSCAGLIDMTANPAQVIVAETEQGRGIVGVVDGFRSKGIETDTDIKDRKEFLRKIGYKL